MNEPRARLRVTQGPQPDKEYAVVGQRTIIGRSQSCDITIVDPEMSRQHAQLVRHGDGFAIEDLGSTNGTFVNGEPVEAWATLEDGDSIDLGKTIRLIYSVAFVDDQPTQPEFEVMPPSELPPSARQAAMPPVPSPAEFAEAPQPGRSRRRWLLGCGCGVLLAVFLCAATLFYLDAYDGGRLLYCGPLQPFFETLLGPVGFSPACAMP